VQAIEELEKGLVHFKKAQLQIEQRPESVHILWAQLHAESAIKYAEFALYHLKQEKEE